MRGLLRRLGARTGISAGLIVIIVAAVAFARLTADGIDRPPEYVGGPANVPSADASAGDDGALAPSSAAISDDAAVRATASGFTSAWLERGETAEAWHAALVPLSTPSLAQSLVGVDPAGVPATRMVGEPTVTLRSEFYAQVTVPVDTGTVLLGMLSQGGGWLVDSVDWQRA